MVASVRAFFLDQLSFGVGFKPPMPFKQRMTDNKRPVLVKNGSKGGSNINNNNYSYSSKRGNGNTTFNSSASGLVSNPNRPGADNDLTTLEGDLGLDGNIEGGGSFLDLDNDFEGEESRFIDLQAEALERQKAGIMVGEVEARLQGEGEEERKMEGAEEVEGSK